MKTYEFTQRQVLPNPGVNSLVIENTENREENFHGIRFSGRIIVDDTVAGFIDGFITLMCIPNDQIAIPAIQSEAVLNDSNSFIIAVRPWMCVNPAAGTTENNEYGSVVDFDFGDIRTSRSCMKGGKIVGQVTVNGGVNSITLTSLLSLFRTSIQ